MHRRTGKKTHWLQMKAEKFFDGLHLKDAKIKLEKEIRED
jgi:hypothetical protein